MQEEGTYFLSTITYTEGNLTQIVTNNGYQGISQLKLKTIRLFGVPSVIDTILVNGQRHTDFEIHLPDNELRVNNLDIPVNSQYVITLSTESNDSESCSVLVALSWILFYVQLSYSFLIFAKNI